MWAAGSSAARRSSSALMRDFFRTLGPLPQEVLLQLWPRFPLRYPHPPCAVGIFRTFGPHREPRLSFTTLAPHAPPVPPANSARLSQATRFPRFGLTKQQLFI